jgi:hypothetical protein
MFRAGFAGCAQEGGKIYRLGGKVCPVVGKLFRVFESISP